MDESQDLKNVFGLPHIWGRLLSRMCGGYLVP